MRVEVEGRWGNLSGERLEKEREDGGAREKVEESNGRDRYTV